MSILKSNNLSELTKDIKTVQDFENCSCADTGECRDKTLQELIKEIIDNNVTNLEGGECINVSNDKINLNIGQGLKNDGNNNVAIDYGGLPLVTPVLNSVIREYNQDKSSLLRTINSNTPIIEDGAVIDVMSAFKYTLFSLYSKPTSISGDYGTAIPNDNIYSTPILINNYNINSGALTKTVTFTTPRSGLNVINNKVVKPVGNETTFAKLIVTMNYPFYLGYSNVYPVSIDSFDKKLSLKTSSLTFVNVTSNNDEYTYFVYPDNVIVNNIIMDGAAPVLGAFSKIQAYNITTGTGVVRTMNILKSNALGAFNNNTLRFDFEERQIQ